MSQQYAVDGDREPFSLVQMAQNVSTLLQDDREEDMPTYEKVTQYLREQYGLRPSTADELYERAKGTAEQGYDPGAIVDEFFGGTSEYLQQFTDALSTENSRNYSL